MHGGEEKTRGGGKEDKRVGLRMRSHSGFQIPKSPPCLIAPADQSESAAQQKQDRLKTTSPSQHYYYYY